jgi:hypothetical protein
VTRKKSRVEQHFALTRTTESCPDCRCDCASSPKLLQSSRGMFRFGREGRSGRTPSDKATEVLGYCYVVRFGDSLEPRLMSRVQVPKKGRNLGACVSFPPKKGMVPGLIRWYHQFLSISLSLTSSSRCSAVMRVFRNRNCWYYRILAHVAIPRDELRLDWSHGGIGPLFRVNQAER